MTRSILLLWRKRQRAIDLQILWPSCKELASDMDHARAAFFAHCCMDTAWTKDFSHSALADFVGALL